MMHIEETDKDLIVACLMKIALILPVGIAVSTVVVSPVIPEGASIPYGYTWSLLIFIVPVCMLAWWFLRYPDPELKNYKKAFWFAITLFTIAGVILDICFGLTLFKFPNHEASVFHVFGYKIGYGWVREIPIEEFGFYFFGILFMLLTYIWADVYWLKAHCVDHENQIAERNIEKIVSPNYYGIIWGIVLIGLATLFKKYAPHSGTKEGFPAYFTVLVVCMSIPWFTLLPTIKWFVNWRAFSHMLNALITISLIWEVTLGIPYGWWGFNDKWMMGIYIPAWSRLPIEEIVLWLSAGASTVVVYETAKLYFYMKKPFREALFGYKR